MLDLDNRIEWAKLVREEYYSLILKLELEKLNETEYNYLQQELDYVANLKPTADKVLNISAN